MDGIIKEPTLLLKRELESWLNAEEYLLHAFEEDWNLMLIIMVLKLCVSQLLGTPAAENAAAPSGVHKHLYSCPKDTLSAPSPAGSLSPEWGGGFNGVIVVRAQCSKGSHSAHCLALSSCVFSH